MSGIPKFNFPAFYEAGKVLREAGYDVVSPAELDDSEHSGEAMASPDGSPGSSSTTWGECLARDVRIIADTVGGVVFLPDWEGSRGARLEAFTGLLCGHQFALYTPEIEGRMSDVTADYVARRVL
jgi:hypothetical protein